MSKETKAKQPEQLGLVDLYKEEQELKERLEAVRQKRADMAKEQANQIRQRVVDTLVELSHVIEPLVNQDAWSWRASAELENVLDALDLAPKEAKPVVVEPEQEELIIGYLKSQPNGATIDAISAGIKDAKGEVRWQVGSLRPKLPVLVKKGTVKSKPNPNNQRQNIYFVE